MKIYSLNWEDDDPIFNFNLLGLKANLTKDYDLIFLLNKSCSFNFSRIEDQKFFDDLLIYTFSVYRFFDTKTKQNIEIISNYSHPKIIEEKNQLFDKSEVVKVLIPEYNYFNYFLKSDFLLNEEFYVTLQKVNFIEKYGEINLNKIKKNNLENLILTEG